YSGHHCLLYCSCSVSVRGHLATEAVCLGDDGPNLFIAELGCFRRVTLREHAAARTDFDAVSSILRDLAGLLKKRRSSIRYTVSLVLELRVKQVLVAMSAGYSDGRSRSVYPWAWDVAGVDRIAQRYVGVTVRAYIAHGRETGFQSHSCVLSAIKR